MNGLVSRNKDGIRTHDTALFCISGYWDEMNVYTTAWDDGH